MVLITITSCGTEDCNSTTEAVSCLDDFGCQNAAFQLSVESQQEFELIRSQEDFDNMVFGNCDVQVDWEEFDLVIGTIGLQSGLASIQKSLRKDCDTNQILLDITIITNSTALAPSITWQAVIPKLADDESLFVEILID